VGLSKANRLKDRRDFQAVYSQGTRYSSSHLIVRALAISLPQVDSQTPIIRMGISISKKVSKKATIRNRLKRLIRVALRELLPKIISNWYIVVIVKVGATECKYDRFLRELEQLLKKAKAIDGN
jgi:ribonuclease P protein component